MTTTRKDLRTALEARLAAIASPLPTQYENSAYMPVAGAAYQQIYLLLAEPDNPETGRFNQQNGIFQINLRYPINNGPGTGEVRAQEIADWFYKGLSLAANGLTVTVNRTPAIGPGAVDGDRYVLPVKVRFYANVSS